MDCGKSRGTSHKDPFDYLKSMGITEAQFQQDIKNGLEEGLTVSQYNELKQEIETLKSLLAEKLVYKQAEKEQPIKRLGNGLLAKALSEAMEVRT